MLNVPASKVPVISLTRASRDLSQRERYPNPLSLWERAGVRVDSMNNAG